MGRQTRPRQGLRDPDYAVQRRSNLVAHVGQEFGLGPVAGDEAMGCPSGGRQHHRSDRAEGQQDQDDGPESPAQQRLSRPLRRPSQDQGRAPVGRVEAYGRLVTGGPPPDCGFQSLELESLGQQPQEGPVDGQGGHDDRRAGVREIRSAIRLHQTGGDQPGLPPVGDEGAPLDRLDLSLYRGLEERIEMEGASRGLGLADLGDQAVGGARAADAGRVVRRTGGVEGATFAVEDQDRVEGDGLVEGRQQVRRRPVRIEGEV